MKTIPEIKESLSPYKSIVLEKYNVTNLGIFGPYGGSEENEESDIVLVVDYGEIPSLIELIELENYLSENVGFKVSVATKNGLISHGREWMLEEVVNV